MGQAQHQAWDPPHRALYYIYYMYMRDFAPPVGDVPDSPEFSRLGDEMAYVFPSDGGVTCLALSVNPEEYRRLRVRGLDRFRERLAEHRGLAERVAGATLEGRLLGTGPEPSYVRVPVGPGWELVGDAGMHQDPWGGMGMDMGMTHAAALAEALVAWFGGELPEAEALDHYHRRRDESGMRRYRTITDLGRDLRTLDRPPTPAS